MLVGTYEMRPFRTVNAQLACRSIDVHFARYNATQEHERAIFKSVLWALQRQLPVAHEPADLLREWEWLYARSLGCVGLLKQHLNQALGLALAEKADTVTTTHLRKTVLHKEKVDLALEAILDGEKDFLEAEDADFSLLIKLGMGQTSPPENTTSAQQRGHALAVGIAACIEAVGGCRQLARLVKVPNMLFSAWQNRQRTPSLTYMLAVGYVLNLSPLQLITVEPERVKETLRAQMVYRSPPDFKHNMSRSQGDSVSIQAFLQSVLHGATGPLPLRHVARHLGVGEKYLVGRFPQECAAITTEYLAHRAVRAKERVERECDEVRQAVFALREQGVRPSIAQVTARLSHPYLLRRPEAKATWRALRSELEGEQE